MSSVEIDLNNKLARDFLIRIAPTEEEMNFLGYTKREIQRMFPFHEPDIEKRRLYWLTAQTIIVSARKLMLENDQTPTWTAVKMSTEAFLLTHNKEVNSGYISLAKHTMENDRIALHTLDGNFHILAPVGAPVNPGR